MTDDEQESDEMLMVRVQGGDHRAFSALVRRHTQRFYACAYRICAQNEMAEDIVQEAFLKLWARPQSWEAGRGAKFTTWFYRVVTNVALDERRKKKPQLAGESLDIVEDLAPRQDEMLERGETQQALECAIQKLPERQKMALNLCFYEGMSNKDAADILGVSVKGLESLLMRAKAGVRDRLIRAGISSREAKYYG